MLSETEDVCARQSPPLSCLPFPQAVITIASAVTVMLVGYQERHNIFALMKSGSPNEISLRIVLNIYIYILSSY